MNRNKILDNKAELTDEIEIPLDAICEDDAEYYSNESSIWLIDAIEEYIISNYGNIEGFDNYKYISEDNTINVYGIIWANNKRDKG